MKLSKFKVSFVLIVIVLIIIFVWRFAYFLGQHDANLTITQATPLQLAQAMQGDNFYGKYTQTMLLITGSVKAVSQNNTGTIIQFNTTNKPTVLGTVSCDISNNKGKIRSGDIIKVLTVAHDALRKNKTDVFIPNCYLLK